MISIVTCTVIASAVLGNSAAQQSCALPLQPAIDWSRLPSSWNLVITDDPPPHDDMFTCITASISRIDDQVDIKISGDTGNGKKSMFMRSWEVAGGQYEALLHPEGVSEDMLQEAITAHRVDKGSALPIVATSFLTDYESYFIIFACGIQGYKDIWVFSPNRYISVDQTLSYVNEIRLYDQWRSQKLRKSICPAPK